MKLSGNTIRDLHIGSAQRGFGMIYTSMCYHTQVFIWHLPVLLYVGDIMMNGT